jgi:hypothetical protein
MDIYQEDADNNLPFKQNRLNRLLDVVQKDALRSLKSYVAPQFTQSEIAYLLEYLIIMEPIVIGLDQLQGEHNSGAYYGFLVPTIFSIRYKLQRLKDDTRIVKLKNTLERLIEKVEERFKSFFNVDESSRFAMTATFCHPEFKLYFLAEGSKKEAAMKMVTEESNKYKAASTEAAASSSQSQPRLLQSSNPNLYDWFSETEPSQVSDELQTYLISRDKSLTMLNQPQFKTLKAMFLRFNGPLASSGAVERVFNYAGMINTAKRNRMSPQVFKQNILLKANDVFETHERKNQKSQQLH